MKLIAQVRLQPTPEQADALRHTMESANAAANRLSDLAWENGIFRQFALHRLAYHAVRAETGLAAQMIVRLIQKVSDAYRLDHKTKRVFRAAGAINYDDRILRWYPERVSIWTTAGRAKIPFVCGSRQRAMLASRQGESQMVYANGAFYLMATCDISEQPPGTPDDWLGVDLGVVNIATTSDGEVMSGAILNGLRHRHRRLRKKLQSKGTRGARRVLIRQRRRERRFAAHTNHCLSKKIVVTAGGTNRGIALEDLTHIRARITARKPQRATLSSWSFGQLRAFFEYKARLIGVPVALVDPRNTSRTCPVCGHIAKANRKDQAHFSCGRCGFAGLADHVAAENIRRAVCNAAKLPESSTPRQSRLQ